MALSAFWFSDCGDAMRAYYFLRAALILCALFATVQPAYAVVQNPTNNYSCSSTSGLCPVASGVLSQFQGEACAAGGTATLQFLSNRFSCRNIYVERFYLTISGAPACAVGFSYNSATGYCEGEAPPACPAANSSAGSYWINSGTVPDSLYTVGLGQQCLNGCQTEGYSAVVTAGGGGNAEAATKIVAGVKQYYAKRYFYYTGQTCTGNTQPSSGEVPGQQTCAAGQSYIQMGTQFKCINPVTGQTVDTNSASAVAAAQTLADAKAAAAIAAAASAVAAAGGSASAVENARSVAAGVAAAGGSDSGSSNPDPVQSSFCAENPTSSICQEQEFGNVDDSTLGDKTVSVAISPVSVGGAGSCPAPSVMVLHGHTYYFDWTTYCNFANGIRPILLAFAWLAAAGILVGGFMA